MVKKPQPIPKKKFLVWDRYQRLSRNNQRIVKGQMQRRFGVSETSIYHILKNDNLTADQLIFFAELFDCNVRDLYTQQPPVQRRIDDLQKTYEEQMESLTEKLGLAS